MALTTLFMFEALMLAAMVGAIPPELPQCPDGGAAGSPCDFDGDGSPCGDYEVCLPSPGGGVCCSIPDGMCPFSENQGPRCSLEGDGTPCKPGYVCTLLPLPTRDQGVCCSLPDVCPKGTVKGKQCLVGDPSSCDLTSVCHPIPGTVDGAAGVCCDPELPPSPCLDPSFEGPACSPDGSGEPCKSGYTCTPRKDDPSTGACCFVPNVCPEGTLEGPLCSPKGQPTGCKPGYRCTQIPFSKLGSCCSDNNQGRCPPSNDRPRPCRYGENVNSCRRNTDCPPFHKCCRRGCEKVCERAIYDKPPSATKPPSQYHGEQS